MMLRLPTAKSRGQAFIELAMVVPMIAFITFACLQLVVLFLAYLSVMNSARDLSRWVAVHPNTIDSDAKTALLARLPRNLSSANMTIAITPACSSLTNGVCTSRPTGTTVAFSMTYNAASLVYLPTQYGCCGFTMSIPATLPTYTINMVTEPA